MVAPPLIPSNYLWTLVWIIWGVVLLYVLICFVQALRTPPDAWTETNKAGGFPKRRE